MNNKKDIVAIIPARGGSKTIPNKNVLSVAGIPLIAYTIRAAQKSKSITRLIVSTDDNRISEISKEYGAEVIIRPRDISGDFASSESAILHVLEVLGKEENYFPFFTVFLQCTAPLITADDIDKTIEKLISTKADTAFSSVPFHYFLWKSNLNDGNYVEGINHNKTRRLLRQQKQEEYLENGSVYVMKTDMFLEEKHRFFGKTASYLIKNHSSMEIDEPDDLIIAEVLLKEKAFEENLKLLPGKLEGLFLDFDGVFTDNKVYLNENGEETVRCSRGDGYGISMLKKKINIPIVVFSSEEKTIAVKRCKKLKIECFNYLKESKYRFVLKYCEDNNINYNNVIFIGNDINDYDCLINAGCSVAPNDAVDSIKSTVDLILKNNGGSGAVRELCDLILRKYIN